MKRIAITFCAAAFLFACNSEEKTEATAGDTKVASSTTETTTEEWVPVDTAAMNKAWMENMTPGKEHAMLAQWDGAWEAEATSWMAPDAPPTKDKGTAVNKMILGGRYQETDYKGQFWGQPYNGHGMVGYDNTKKVFTSRWIDNMGTTPMTMEGTWDEAAKAINFKGKMICSANGKEIEMKEVYQIVDDKTHVMTMYGPDMTTGKEFKNMEIKFTRK